MNPSELQRDHWVGMLSEDRRLFYARPVREWAKWTLRLVDYLLSRYLRPIHRSLVRRRLKKGMEFARPRDPGLFAYVPGRPYFEIQIGNETRTAALLDGGEELSFEEDLSQEDSPRDLLFGIAPLVPPEETDRVRRWSCRLSIEDLASKKVSSWEEEFPFNGRSDLFAYYPGDGWVECCHPLDAYKGKRISISISGRSEGDGVLVPISIASPQVVSRREKAKNVLLVSFESLTDPQYLRQNYREKVPPLPNLEKLSHEGTVYPKVYSPTDSTLSFAASILSGLLPSQHGIGNYAIAADAFVNNVFHPDLRTLPRLFKGHRFRTFFGGTQARFSSKVGWARGFDHYFHVFEKWGENVPQFEWLTRTFREFRNYDKFVAMHIDYLHEPYVSFNDKERIHLRSLRAAGNEEGLEALYFEQLRRLDFQLGLFLDYLERSGEREQTAIVITGDHGGGIRWAKHQEFALYEERVRVPLIIKYPEWQKDHLEPRPITNSISEIYRLLHHLLGERLPDYTAELPQYRSEYSPFAFSETIMNPKYQYKKYNLALMNHPYKYLLWGEVDWDRFRFEKRSREALFLWEGKGSTYQEDRDLLRDEEGAALKYRQLAERYLAENLRFMEKFPPQRY